MTPSLIPNWRSGDLYSTLENSSLEVLYFPLEHSMLGHSSRQSTLGNSSLWKLGSWTRTLHARPQLSALGPQELSTRAIRRSDSALDLISLSLKGMDLVPCHSDPSTQVTWHLDHSSIQTLGPLSTRFTRVHGPFNTCPINRHVEVITRTKLIIEPLYTSIG